MRVAAKVAIRLIDGVVNTIVLIVVMALLAFSCYTIWDSHQVDQGASAAQYQVYKPTLDGPSAGDVSPLVDLQNINPDVFGWLTVFGTKIDYPMVQGTDNMRYVKTDVKGQYSASGSIFIDYRNNRSFTDFSTIIYGHHMRSGAMFGDIGLFYDAKFFDAHKYGALYFDGQQRGLEFFAFVHTSAYDDTVYTTPVVARDGQTYLNMLTREARFVRTSVSVSTSDHIVILSTCSSRTTNGRDVLIGKIVDHVIEDPTIQSVSDGSSNTSTFDHLPNLWTRLPMWAKILGAAVPLGLAVVMLLVVLQRRADTYQAKRFASDVDVHTSLP